jgi:hypothetical protein
MPVMGRRLSYELPTLIDDQRPVITVSEAG